MKGLRWLYRGRTNACWEESVKQFIQLPPVQFEKLKAVVYICSNIQRKRAITESSRRKKSLPRIFQTAIFDCLRTVLQAPQRWMLMKLQEQTQTRLTCMSHFEYFSVTVQRILIETIFCIAVHECKRETLCTAESILILQIHFSLSSHHTSGANGSQVKSIFI